MTGLFSILAGAVGGAVIGFFGNYLLERVKRRTALNDASRKAYASWFTAEALTYRRVNVVCKKLVEVCTNILLSDDNLLRTAGLFSVKNDSFIAVINACQSSIKDRISNISVSYFL